MTRAPLVPDVGVLALVPDTWGGPWQPRHHVLTRLANVFPVVWVNPAPYWRSLLPGTPSDDWDFDFDGATPPGFRTYTPAAWLPEVYRPPVLARWMRRELLRRARRMLARHGCRKTVLYLWRPEHARALDLVEHDLTCYHIDDEYTFSPIEQPLAAPEAALIRRVDQVFIHSQGLLDKKGHLNPRTRFVPNGVDYDRYTNALPGARRSRRGSRSTNRLRRSDQGSGRPGPAPGSGRPASGLVVRAGGAAAGQGAARLARTAARRDAQRAPARPEAGRRPARLRSASRRAPLVLCDG
jgi:hypothetical protein